MVGDARDRDIRDMNARRTAGGGSCYRDRVGIGTEIETLRPGDRTSRRHRELIVSSQFLLRSYCKICSDRKAVRSARCLRPFGGIALSAASWRKLYARVAPLEGCIEVGVLRGTLDTLFSPVFLHARSEINPRELPRGG